MDLNMGVSMDVLMDVLMDVSMDFLRSGVVVITSFAISVDENCPKTPNLPSGLRASYRACKGPVPH